MLTFSKESPVTAELLQRFILQVMSIELSSEELHQMLEMVLAQDCKALSEAYGLQLAIQGFDSCWLQVDQQPGCGIFVCLRNRSDGVWIRQVRDLGGGRRCGWWPKT